MCWSMKWIMSLFKSKEEPVKDYPVFMPALREHLKREEGEKFKPYRCTSGKLTIGVGRNLQDVGISQDESDYLLFNDIQKVLIQVERMFPEYEYWKVGRIVAVCSMLFQMGVGGFLGFKSTIRYIKQDKWEEAANQAMQSRWATQTPNRARRVCEMLRTGELVK